MEPLFKIGDRVIYGKDRSWTYWYGRITECVLVRRPPVHDTYKYLIEFVDNKYEYSFKGKKYDKYWFLEMDLEYDLIGNRDDQINSLI